MPLNRRSPRGPAPRHEPEVERNRSVARTRENAVGAVSQTALSSLANFGGIEQDEIILARLKLMQGQSPEIQNPDQFPHARNGEFFHSVTGRSLGKSLRVIPVWKRRSYELWGDRDSNQGLLASADESGIWDKPHHKFEITTRNGVLRVDTKANVFDSGLLNFGTSDPRNPKSKPLVAETYRLVLFLPDHPNQSPVMCIFARMAGIQVKDLLTKMQYRIYNDEPIPHQVFDMRSNLDKLGANSFFCPHFSNLDGHDDERLAKRIEALAVSLNRAKRVKASDEDEEQKPRAGARRRYNTDEGDY